MMGMNNDAIFKALANRERRMLLDQLLKSNGLTLHELCESLFMTRQAVSKHLRILQKANMIGVVWRGREKLHFLNPAPIQAIYDRWMKKYHAHYIVALEQLKRNPELSTLKKEK